MIVRSVAAALLASATLLHGQQSMPGYTPEGSNRQRALEAAAIRAPSPERSAEMSRALSAETHVAGTPAQRRTADYVIQQMRQMGLETEVRTYRIWLPHATSVRLWRIAPQPAELDLREPAIAGDPSSALPQYPTVNGYSGAGDVTGEVVFVNFGLIENWRKAKRGVEFHYYERGGHGFGMYRKETTSTGWFDAFVRWIGMHGMLKPAH